MLTANESPIAAIILISSGLRFADEVPVTKSDFILGQVNVFLNN